MKQKFLPKKQINNLITIYTVNPDTDSAETDNLTFQVSYIVMPLHSYLHINKNHVCQNWFLIHNP
jgi:hypothetical protein